jgi:phosphatidylinositol alpha-1,6-mannosyltransferase
MDRKKEPNFLLTTLEYTPFKGGVANYYANMISNWPGEIEVLTTPGEDERQEDKVTRKKLLNKKFLPTWLPSIFHVWRTISKKNIDHVMVGHILPLGTAVLVCSKFLNIKYSVFLHGMDICFALKQTRKRQLAIKILTHADSIICANSYVKDTVKNIVPEKENKRIKTVNPGIAKNIYSPPEKKEMNNLKNKYDLQNDSILFSIGRIVERKGFDKAIEAMPAILKEKNDVIYVIAGAGPDEPLLQNKIKELDPDIQKKILILGKISDDEKWCWLHLCDVFLMPSRDINGDLEGFGIVYLEANLAGKPAVGGDTGGVRDAISHGVNGYLADPNDPKSIAEKVTTLLNNKKLQEEVGRKGRQRAINEFNWKKQAEKIYKHLKNNQ